MFGKKKKKTSRGKFEKLEVGGEMLPVHSFYLYTSKDDGKRYIELTAAQELPQLHFSEVKLDVFMSTKKLSAFASFVDAFAKGSFKIYKFAVLSIEEYYI